MNISIEIIIMTLSALVALLLFIFAVDWRYFQEWVVVYLFKGLLDFAIGSPVVELKLVKYPVRLLPKYYDTAILFELWIFPVLCILYNQITRRKGLWPILYYAVLFSAGITGIEYYTEKYTKLITYINWSWFTSFYTLTLTFLLSRLFMAFYRWGCDYFGQRQQ
jgi:hypothetical protein